MRTFIVAIFLCLFALVPVAFADPPLGGGTGTYVAPSGGGGVTGPFVAPASQPSGEDITLINPLNIGSCTAGQNCLLIFLNKILELIIQIGTVAIILMLVYIGYLFVVAQGNESKITEARNALLWTVIGALVLLGAQVIASGIAETVKALAV